MSKVRTIAELEKYEDSKLWKELLKRCRANRANRVEVSKMKMTECVRQVAGQAAYIQTLIGRSLPQYTLHNERHTLNVIAWMDALTECWRSNMTHFELGLCLLGAYVHDLGMALPAEDLSATLHDPDSPEAVRYESYKATEHPDLLERISHLEELSEKAQGERQEELKGDILSIQERMLTSYLRRGHAEIEDVACHRLRGWCREIKDIVKNEGLFNVGGVDLSERLVKICVSHVQTVDWLRQSFCSSTNRGYIRSAKVGNLALPGLLLRLADIMDWDDTRTPLILYRNVGITDGISICEWEKHIAVKDRQIEQNGSGRLAVQYIALDCTNPVVHKTCLEFGSAIQEEIDAVQLELNVQKEHDSRLSSLKLPDKAEVRVEPKEDDGVPLYVYEDVAFHLDQHQIMQLLLGEKLYGDPGLCIRELLQNALDAVELRDLRRRVLDQKPDAGLAADPYWPDEDPLVTLSWGHDAATGRDFIEVDDNGTGMTKSIVLHFFANIGQSYYKSKEYAREQRLIETVLQEPVSSISQFGIGILSCFMLADRIEVSTNPGKGYEGDDGKPWDVTITGPGDLFWFRQGTRKQQGTFIRILLKEKYRVQHDAAKCREQLQHDFGYISFESGNPEYNKDKHIVDPAYLAARHVLWPLYKVRVRNAKGKEVLSIDPEGSLHGAGGLFPIATEAVRRKAAEWGIEIPLDRKIIWSLWHWTDKETGSRIGVWYPSREGTDAFQAIPPKYASPESACSSILSSLVETTLPRGVRERRSTVIVESMTVPDTDAVGRNLALLRGVGCRLWIDLRKDAAPLLKADRTKAFADESMAQKTTKLINNWVVSCAESIERCETDLWTVEDATYVTDTSRALWRLRQKHLAVFEWYIGSVFTFHKPGYTLCAARFMQRLDLDYAFNLHRTFTPDLIGNLDRASNLDSLLDLDCVLNLDRFQFQAGYHSRACDLVTRIIKRTLDPDRALDLGLDSACAFDRVLNCARAHARARFFTNFSAGPLFQAHTTMRIALFSILNGLERSMPSLDLCQLEGYAGDAKLLGPARVQFRTEPDTPVVVRPPEPIHASAKLLIETKIDLVFPYFFVGLGSIRDNCPNWNSQSQWISSLPFFYPDVAKELSEVHDKLQELIGVKRVHAFLAVAELWEKPFTDWTEADWTNKDHLSATWDITRGAVKCLHGLHDPDETWENGFDLTAAVWEEYEREKRRDGGGK